MDNYNNILSVHTDLWSRYRSFKLNRAIDSDDKENRFDEPWQFDHYFKVGEDAIRIVMAELYANGRSAPETILDFPSGSGRVTRHLQAMFPDARIGACDLYQRHVEFCAREFGVIPLPSCENLAELAIGQWDLIFCGSLLTHLPYPLFVSALEFMARSLTANGIAIVTIEGRHSLEIQDHKWKLINDDLFDVARTGFHESGFGYVDYGHQFREGTFNKQNSYGVTLVNPSRILKEIQELPDVRILGFRERAWDDHQDVVVFGRPGVNI